MAAPRKGPNLYDVLGVGRSASDDDIKKAYKGLARKYHPDLNQNNPAAEGMFQKVTRAYEVLTDPVKRDQYDRALAEEDRETYTEVAPKPSRRSDFVFFVFVLFLVLAMLFFFIDTAKGTYFLVVAVTLEIKTSIEAIRTELRQARR